MSNRTADRFSGFTLVELIVVIAIIAILATIAFPVYNSYIEKTQLADAKRAATTLRQSFEAARLERPQVFRKADGFKQEVTKAKNNAINADVAKLFTFTETYLPDAQNPKSFSVAVTPKTKGRKYGLKLDSSGDVLRCPYSGSALAEKQCEKF